MKRRLLTAGFRRPLAAERLEDRTTPVAGDLDATFNGSGFHVTGFVDPVDDNFFGVTVDSVNRTIAVGEAGGDVLAVRYRPDGTLDPQFGGDGIVTVDLGGGFDEARGVYVRSDGSLLIGAWGFDVLDDNFCLVELSPTGDLVQINRRDIEGAEADDRAFGFAVNPATEDAYVVGAVRGDLAVVHFAPDGSYADEAVIDISGNDAAWGAAVDPATGKLFVGASADGQGTFAVMRFNADLSGPVLDTYDLGGAEQSAKGVAVDSARGRVFFGGTADPAGTGLDFTVVVTDAGLNKVGSTAFDMGVSNNGVDRIRGLALDGTGRLIAAGRVDAPSQVPNAGLARLVLEADDTFAFDDTFAGDGARTYNLNDDDRAFAVAVTPDGQIVFAGQNANDPVVARVLGLDGPVIPPPNDPPDVIPPAGGEVVFGSGPVGPLAVTVSDPNDPADILVLTATTNNAALFPAGSVVLAGSGANRTITLTPAVGVSGTATITLTVTDPAGAADTATFTVTVRPNVLPVISNIPDQTVALGQTTAALTFTVNDLETPVAQLVVTGASSNGLVPATGFTFTGFNQGSARTVRLTPLGGQSGTTTITLTVTDGNGGTGTETFQLTVTGNNAPTVSPVADAMIGVNETLPAFAFSVGDIETPAGQLTVTATSNNPALFPAGSLTLAGSGAARTLTAVPVRDATGTATLTLTVTDGSGATTQETFDITVSRVVPPPPPPNTPPTIGDVADRGIAQNGTSGPIAFTVFDAETPLALLQVTALSNNTDLVPTANVVLGGSGANRTVTVTPVAGRFGSATLSLTVSDGQRTTTDTFTVNVPVVDPGTPPTGQFAVGMDAGGGSATLYDSDLTERFTVQAFSGFTGGVRVAVADFNGDGVGDLVVGTGPGRATFVRVLDGVTQQELFAVAPFEPAFVGGVYVAAGDLTGDGRPDLVITPDEGGGPRVDVYTGNGFTKAASFFGIDDPNFRGGARASTGDMNGDRVDDLIVVAGFGGGPRVAGFDGLTVTGTPRRLFGDFFAFEQTLRNGVFVTAGDLDGDGFAELIAGGGPGGGPRVTAFDGAALVSNQLVIRANFFGGDDDSRGGIRLTVANLDDDNRADLIVGAGDGSGDRATAYAGKDISVAGTPPVAFDFAAFDGFGGGVFVG